MFFLTLVSYVPSSQSAEITVPGNPVSSLGFRGVRVLPCFRVYELFPTPFSGLIRTFSRYSAF